MSQFVDRIDDLATLEDQFALEEATFVVLYGRRRIGKTALISEFVRDKNALYFLATEESEEQNRKAFQNRVADFTNDALLAQAQVDSWDLLFDRLTQSGERMVIALDEFQYLGKANAAFPSIFQRIWDTILSKRNVMVVLCGSLISLMESQVLSYSSPLYGRRTAQIRMRQIPFRHYSEFFPALPTRRDLVMRYAVTGGVPKYIESFNSKEPIFRAIQKYALNENCYLFDEPNFLLSKEVSEVGSYFSILKAIAAGNRKSGEIAAALNVKQTNLSKYLKVLERLDLLEREVPVTELNPEKSKKGLYRIKDNFIRFWFRFVFPNRGLLETGHAQEVLSLVRRDFVDSHVSYVYEEVCKEALWDLGAQKKLPFVPTRVGSWWGRKDVEIDAVCLDASGRKALFAECKFWEKPVGVNVLKHLEDQVAKAREDAAFKGYNYAPAFAVFSVSGFTDELVQLAKTRKDVFLFE